MPWDWDKLQKQKMGKGGNPPQMDEVFDKFKGLKGKLPGLWVVIGIVIILIIMSSSVYTIGVNEVGIIQRFGKYVRTTSPGLSFKLPWGIEKLTKVPVRLVKKEEFGLRTIRPGIRTQYARSTEYLNEIPHAYR